MTEESQEEKIQKILKETEKIKQENQSLKEEIDEIKNQQKTENKIENADAENISRRDFLKKAGLGTLGLGALLSPVSALDVKTDDFNVLTSSGGGLAEGLKVDSSQNVMVPNGNMGIGVSNPSLPLEIGGSNGVRIPVGDNSQRSSSPIDGEVRINSESLKLEVYHADRWRNIGDIFYPMEASGGDEIYTYTDDNGTDYRVHVFTSTGTSEFTVEDTGDESNVEALIVAGGGGGGGSAGGSAAGGGGGAGGLINDAFSVTEGVYDVVVGSGGSGASGDTDEPGQNGGNSEAFNQVAIGGGGGGHRDNNQTAKDGGSGGGAGAHNDSPGGSADQGQGHDGGSSGESVSADNPAAGGGGATQAGESVDPTGAGGDGGDGKDVSNLFGTEFGEDGIFAGGGAGGDGGSGGNGVGGVGGGGNADQNAQKNTGGGGGGVITADTGPAGDGGSGIVLIRYPLEKP